MSLYDATQYQRKIERGIRHWKREASALESASLDSSTAKLKVREWQARQRDFISQTGLRRDYFRERAGVQNEEIPSKKYSDVIGMKTSTGITITEISKHFIERMYQRGVQWDNAVKALTSPIHVDKIKVDERGRKSQKFIGMQETVAINPDTGVIASTYRTGSSKRKRYSKEEP